MLRPKLFLNDPEGQKEVCSIFYSGSSALECPTHSRSRNVLRLIFIILHVYTLAFSWTTHWPVWLPLLLFLLLGPPRPAWRGDEVTMTNLDVAVQIPHRLTSTRAVVDHLLGGAAMEIFALTNQGGFWQRPTSPKALSCSASSYSILNRLSHYSNKFCIALRYELNVAHSSTFWRIDSAYHHHLNFSFCVFWT